MTISLETVAETLVGDQQAEQQNAAGQENDIEHEGTLVDAAS
jgi:hypothetical protein